jgi:AbrB family looped-hinge helix DNA binding protein
MDFVRRVHENGKITIPKELRDLQGIQEGDYVRVQIVEVVKRRPPASEEAAA